MAEANSQTNDSAESLAMNARPSDATRREQQKAMQLQLVFMESFAKVEKGIRNEAQSIKIFRKNGTLCL